MHRTDAAGVETIAVDIWTTLLPPTASLRKPFGRAPRHGQPHLELHSAVQRAVQRDATQRNDVLGAHVHGSVVQRGSPILLCDLTGGFTTGPPFTGHLTVPWDRYVLAYHYQWLCSSCRLLR